MGKPFSQAGGRNPELLITTINQAWNKAGNKQSTVYQEIAFVGEGGGVYEEFPMHLAAQSEKEVADDAERDFNEPYVISVGCESKRIDGPATLLPIDDSRDPYDVLASAAPTIIRQGDRMWDRRLAARINANPACYDGKAMYATDHPVNPSVAGSGTYSNDISAELDEDGLVAALQQLMDIKGADGNRLNVDLGIPLIVVPTKQLEIKARKLIDGGLIARVFGANTAAAAETSHLEGMAEVRVLAELNDATVANSNKRWYVNRVNATPAKPWIVRITKRPQLKMTSDQDFLAHTKNRRAVYYWASGGAAPGLPQLSVRCLTA